jgi:hypothetical protein
MPFVLMLYRLEPTATSSRPSRSLFAVEDRCESIADSTIALTQIEAYSATAVSERVRGREKPFVRMLYRLEPTATSSRPSRSLFAVEHRCESIADSTNAVSRIEAYSATAVLERVRGREKAFVRMPYRLEPTATSSRPSRSLFAVEDRCESIADSTNAVSRIEAYSASAVLERVRGREKPFVLMLYRLEPTASSCRPSSFFFAVEDRCASIADSTNALSEIEAYNATAVSERERGREKPFVLTLYRLEPTATSNLPSRSLFAVEDQRRNAMEYGVECAYSTCAVPIGTS